MVGDYISENRPGGLLFLNSYATCVNLNMRPFDVLTGETALGSHHTGDDVYEIEVGANLKRTIRISGKPPPNRFSLTMRPADTKDSTSLTVLDSDYALSQDGGNLRLELRDVGRSGPGFGYYTFRAGNGVGGSWPQLEYTFTVQGEDP